MVVVRPDMSDEDIISEINAEIATRVIYGRRQEVPPGRHTWRRLEFSVAHADWWQYWDGQRGPSSLDSNEIGVYGISRIRLDPLLEYLDPLPLYRGSFEARQEGGYSLEGIEIPPGLRKAFGIRQTRLEEV